MPTCLAPGIRHSDIHISGILGWEEEHGKLVVSLVPNLTKNINPEITENQ